MDENDTNNQFSKLVLNVNTNQEEINTQMDNENKNINESGIVNEKHTPQQELEEEEEDDDDEEELDIEEPIKELSLFVERDNLFEHFLVIGLQADSNPKIGFIHKPELLFSYPPNKATPPKIPEFCFPNGIIPYIVKRTPSCSNLNEVLYGQPHLHSNSHFYTFVLSGETPLYGVCLTKPELLHTFPNFFPQQPKPLERAQHYTSAPRCYCIISKMPFFTIHFDLLLYLLAQDRLITITRELSSEEETTDETTTTKEQTEKQAESTTPTATTTTTTTTGGDEEEKENVDNVDNVDTVDNVENQDIKDSQVEDTITTTTEPEETNVNIASTPNSSTTTTSITASPSHTPLHPFSNQETRHLVDKQNLLDILEYYYNQKVVEPGQNFEFSFPGEVNLRKYYIPTGKTKTESNYKAIADWAVISTFLNLNLENILKILGAILVEQRVVFVCDNLSILSSASFSMLSFLYPFIWQGLFVPILPSNLTDYLEAPVPFIAGVQQLRKKNFDGLIVDISSNKITYNKCNAPPLLPEFKKLCRNLLSDTQILIQQKNHNPTKNTPTQIESIHRIYITIQNYIWWLVKKIENQFIADPVDIHDSLLVEQFKKRFINSVSDHNKEFVKLLLDTQHFSHFLHNNPNIKHILEEKQQQQTNTQGNI
ncbi:DENN domain-containing protein [Tieghemostelium lacteum]|uniref:DENN domain-containing protein n=1 Tax=Tieghemostelium lacteum TaxID=361077 RepID=A0A151ZDC3_TIELA|nr:DENN domain-containing protein [Tieghemostelium lacteum]|eukprot:KYQ91925.1 DENN domain-containing protein [Tieghemostelium lacteum]